MSDLRLAHEIIQELDRQRKDSPDPVVGERIASAAGLLYYGTMPEHPGLPTGKTPAEVRQMAIRLAAMCMRLVLEMGHE